MIKINTEQCTHLAFSDDSKHIAGRYNSLALVSITAKYYEKLESEIRVVLHKSGIKSEYKWEKVNSARDRMATENLLEFVFFHRDKLKIDILIWNLDDSRHTVNRRDDGENLVRMYYHLVSYVCSSRWPISRVNWQWYPDNQSGVHWDTLNECLVNKHHLQNAGLFSQNYSLFQNVTIDIPQPSDSVIYPFIQVADLFAGIGAYSYGHFPTFSKWLATKDGQISLFDDNPIIFSRSERERFPLIVRLNEMCKANKLRIGLESTAGFKTYEPTKSFINFWLYEPQHSYDKAPTK